MTKCVQVIYASFLRIRITSGENLTEAGRRALKNGIIVIGEVKRIQAQIEDKIPAPG